MTNDNVTRETITDDRIIELNDIRSWPCLTESGECYIVSKARVYDNGEAFEVDRVIDVNVFATEAAAEEYVRRMYYARCETVVKYVYTTRYHRISR